MHGRWYTKTLPKGAIKGHIPFQQQRGTTMIAFILYFFQYAGAAQRVAEAARNHRIPAKEDLAVLDIPASAFAR